MSAFKRKFIDKELVHKKDYKNVFLFNMRRKFQNFFEKDLFELILNKLTDEEKKLILKHYSLTSGERLSFLDRAKSYYMINSIALTLDKEQIEFVKKNKTDASQNLLFSFYQPDIISDQLILSRDINEEEEKQILNILDDKKRYITDAVKTEIANILEKIEETPKGEIIYANMHVNPVHDFFFEHPNEHVPGIMILETFRQFVVAVNHVFGNVPLEDAQLVLECLDSKYFKYTELAFPIILKGYIKDCKWYKEGYWSYLDFETDVLQNNSIVAHFRLYGQIIGKKLFHRIRKKEKEKTMRDYRYILLPEFNNHFSIKHLEDEKYIDVDIINISYSGFMLRSNSFKQEDINNLYNFYLYFHDVGFVHGRCERIWFDTENKTSGFKIISMENDDTMNLKESIGKYCYVYEKREFF